MRIRVPKWTYLRPETKLSEQEWGRYVIVKPIAFGKATYGRGVELARTSALKFKLPMQFSKTHPGRHGLMIVQEFIETGKHSMDYRVVTLFGAPLYAVQIRKRTPMPDLEDPSWTTVTDGVAVMPVPMTSASMTSTTAMNRTC